MKYLAFWVSLLISLQAQAIQVTVTIPPLAALVQPYLDKDDQLTVLLTPGMSPHHFQFRPSHLKALHEADLILTVGNVVDHWAAKPVKQIIEQNPKVLHIAMQKQPGLVVLPGREKALLEESHVKNDGEHHHDHMNPHIWLSIANAKIMIKSIGQAWQILKPLKADQTLEKTEQFLAEMKVLNRQIKTLLAPIKKVPYLVLHDAFYYFENAYGLNNLGTIQMSSEIKPSIKRVLQLRHLIQKAQVRCVFKEPQFPDNQLNYVIRGLNVNIGSLDPMGQFDPSKNYGDFMKELANQYQACLQR